MALVIQPWNGQKTSLHFDFGHVLSHSVWSESLENLNTNNDGSATIASERCYGHKAD